MAERYFGQAKQNWSEADALIAYNRAFDVKNDRLSTRRQKTRADRIMRMAQLLLDDIRRNPGGGGPGAGPEGPDETESAVVDRQPRQQIWAHDAQPESIKSGRTYQYRMRVKLYNRLAGEPDKFSDPDDGRMVLIPGPWSAPTQPVTVEPNTYFFVTNADDKKKNVTTEFYKWFEGVWVKDRVKLELGDAVSTESRQPVPGILGGVDHPTIRFLADAAVVDIQYERRRGERKRAGRDGVRFEAAAPTCSVVVVDSEGRLHERFLEADKGHPAKAVVAGRVWKPPRRTAGP
jgi:hypothetical protein